MRKINGVPFTAHIDLSSLTGGGDNGPELNTIDYITIATLGNATDFGDLTSARSTAAGLSGD
jgi:hypothetical protein